MDKKAASRRIEVIRSVCLGTAVVTTLTASAVARAAPIPVVGYLSRGAPTEPDVCLDLFRNGLASLGMKEGHDYRFLVRYAEQRNDKLEAATRALVAAQPDMLIGTGVKTILLFKQLAPTTPIISAGAGNMVQLGMIKSLARPQGMITGISIGEVQHGQKPLDIMRQAFPKVRKLGLIVDPENEGNVRWVEQIQHGTPQAHGFELIPLYAVTPAELETAFATLAGRGVRHAYIAPSWMDLSPAWAAASNKHRVATISFYTTFPPAGGLMSVGLPSEERCRRLPRYIAQMLKGAKPGDMPVEETGRYILTINLKTAKRLGIRLPRELVLRADRIIE